MLQLENISVRFGTQTALDGLWHTFEPGHIYGLVGPNGCGKSTLMKTCAGLLKNFTGNVIYQGKHVDTSARGRIAYMPTHSVYYRYMTPEDMGSFYEDFFPDFSRTEYRNMINYFGLDANQRLYNMSTGMVAKVRAAATLSRNAGLILLDEPLNGMDLLGQEQMRQILLSLKRPDRSIIVASHMFGQLEAVCDRVVMMNAGKVILFGDIKEMTAQYGMSVSDLYCHTFARILQAQAQAQAMGGVRQ